jgi:hypothetical protein
MIGAAMRGCALHHNADRSSYEGLYSTPQMMIRAAMRDCTLNTMMIRVLRGASMRDCALHHK